MPIFVGTASDDYLQGTAGSDVIAGFGGNDQLFDGGEDAADELVGGDGDDNYFVTNRQNTIVEYSGGGHDWVYTTTSVFILPTFVENLTYTGNGEFAGVGNDLGNFIRGGTMRDSLAGGAGNDILNGESGAANELVGGDGDDTYFSFAAGDSIVEYANGGRDGVLTDLANFTLPTHVEGLRFSGTGPAVGVGNDADNTLSLDSARGAIAGLAGNDLLIAGKAGASELIGGTGNDTYYIVDGGDSVVEYAGEGIDTVEIYSTFTAATSYTLPANVENLRFIGPAALPTPNYAGVGNGGANRLTGADGNDVLSGMDGNDVLDGGVGTDLLIGGSGADQFLFDFGRPVGLDRVIDFESGIDKIVLTGVTPASTATFVEGSVATSRTPTFLYDPATGIVSFDSDGTGVRAALQIAQLNTGLTLSVSDFAFG
jgi:Ca2+-binding RTX toxin-like protein